MAISVTVDSGDSYLDRNKYLFLTKLNLNAMRQWRAYSNSLTDIGCVVEIEGNQYWLAMYVGAGLRGLAQFKEVSPTWLHSKLAQRRYTERAERMLPDIIFKATEHLTFERIMELPPEERQKLMLDCDLVRYNDNNSHWRAHARYRNGDDVHVTEFGTFDGARRMLREWAVANNLYYGGGYTRHDNPETFASFRTAIRTAA